MLTDELANVRAAAEGASEEREAIGTDGDRATATANRIGRAADRLESLGRLADERAQRLTARLAAETEEGYRERIRLLDVGSRAMGPGSPRARSGRRRPRPNGPLRSCVETPTRHS